MKSLSRLFLLIGVLIGLVSCGGGGGTTPPATGSTTCVWDKSTSTWDNCTYGS